VIVLVSVLVAGPATVVEVTTEVVLMTEVLATGTTTTLTLRMTFLITAIFCTDVFVDVGTLLRDFVPSSVEQMILVLAAKT
jgi:hypothetical protein